MRTLLFSLLSFIPFCPLLLIVSVSSQCLNDQKSILIRLKNTLEFNSSISTKIVSWNQSTDCCSWKGVNCSTDGHVIGLDLSLEWISGGVENSSPLFSLHFLQSLNLAYNDFNFTQIPPRIGNLKNLTYLNLSYSRFSGQIPGELSNMSRLVTLDLSYSSLILENPNLAVLLHNLTELTELYLNGVNISAHRYDWSQAISSSLPKLKVLSLSDCFLSGPIDASFANLQSLSVIRLSGNNLSTVPEFFANFTNLTVLELSFCDLYGQFPGKILQVPTLETLDLSFNVLLNGFLPKFPQNASLQTLVLSFTNFSQALPDSIGNLRMLSRLQFYESNFSGQIPHSMASLTQLVNVDLSSNKFSGPIPSFQKSKNLTHLDLSRNGLSGPIPSFQKSKNLIDLDLSYNGLSGPIPSTYFEGLVNLELVDLGFNAFNGTIPPSLFALSSLQNIYLSFNNFNGLLPNFSHASLSILVELDLSSNRLEGPIPKSLFDLKRLEFLSLSNNHLNGTVELEAFSGLGNLNSLDLSYNDLSIETRGENSSLSVLPQFVTLNLASCKLQYFPNLENQSRLNSLDLSNNQIGGEIPSWIWNNQGLYDLNLSHNLFGIWNLEFLDLSNNHLSGTIPSCLVQRSLGVLNLGKNNFSGNIPGTFPSDCRLETLDLHGNRLNGSVPKSLASCTMLEVLNLGNNMINDTFPCFLKNNTNLKVLVLRSNLLHGGIGCEGATKIWPKLQIIDIASNKFTGLVPRTWFLNWRNMMSNEDDVQSKLGHVRFQFLRLNQFFYEDTVTLYIEGHKTELVKILTVFTSIDISNNGFSGEIPNTIWNLKALYVLNISHNAFTGSIPPYIGNLTQLESLDLSVNNLSGHIPIELGSLTFLSFLNLSYNLLEGSIPAGSQLQTFTETSFEGNKGLCGSELNISCVVGPSSPLSEEEDRKGETNGDLISFEVGLVVGLATFIAPLVLSRRWNKWYFKHVDRIIVAKVYRYYQRRNQERRSSIRRL